MTARIHEAFGELSPTRMWSYGAMLIVSVSGGCKEETQAGDLSGTLKHLSETKPSLFDVSAGEPFITETTSSLADHPRRHVSLGLTRKRAASD